MKLTVKKKNELLNYAIKRINQYDKFLKHRTTCMAHRDMPDCIGCSKTGDNCEICPFNIDGNLLGACRPIGQLRKSPKEHQGDLIEAVNNWCKKFYPSYKVARA